MNTITINGVTIQTNSKDISIVNGQVKIDGQTVTEIDKKVKIVWEGDLASLTTDMSVECNNIKGDVNAGGSINCDNVGGTVIAGGSVNCDKVGGDIRAGGSVNSN